MILKKTKMMKIIITSILITVLACTLIGQEEKNFQFGISSYLNRTVQIFEDSNLGISDNSNNFAISGDVFYAISSKVELKSGLSINQVRINLVDYSLLFGCDLDPISGVSNESRSYTKQDYRTYYLGIPLESKIKMIGEENHVYIRLGMEFLFKLGSSKEILLSECGGEEREVSGSATHNLRNVIYNLTSGIGIEAKILKDKKMYIEPQVNYSATSLFEEAGIVSDLTNNVRIIQYGILLGIKF